MTKATTNTLPARPQCQSEFTHEDGALYLCSECAHEWPVQAAEAAKEASKV